MSTEEREVQFNRGFHDGVDGWRIELLAFGGAVRNWKAHPEYEAGYDAGCAARREVGGDPAKVGFPDLAAGMAGRLEAARLRAVADFLGRV